MGDESYYADIVSGLGEQIERLSIANGNRNADGSISATLEREGHVFFGPYLSVPPGPYSARMVFSADVSNADESGLVLEAAWSERTIASAQIDDVAIESGVVVLQFWVPFDEGINLPSGPEARLEIRVFSKGQTPFRVTSVDVRRVRVGDARRAI